MATEHHLELHKLMSDPNFFAPLPRAFRWFTSVLLAWILLGVIGFVLFISYLFKK